MKRLLNRCLCLLTLAFSACREEPVPQAAEPDASGALVAPFAAARAHMVEHDLALRGIQDPRLLAAMATVPREAFVLPAYRDDAYDDRPLPIQAGQTISQPFIVAAMTEALQVKPDHRILEIGTGSGYQAAVLADLVTQVYTIEIIEELANSAAEVLKDLSYTNVVVKAGDGYKGWPDHAPFDGIIVTAAPEHVPQPLVDQLSAGGRMIIPVGPQYAVQHLLLIEKDAEGNVSKRNLMDVRFVPFTGEGVRKKPYSANPVAARSGCHPCRLPGSGAAARGPNIRPRRSSSFAAFVHGQLRHRHALDPIFDPVVNAKLEAAVAKVFIPLNAAEQFVNLLHQLKRSSRPATSLRKRSIYPRVNASTLISSSITSGVKSMAQFTICASSVACESR
jgi:protein-L-isoaspartate(D-aspartate) O-methyltransferase